MPAGHDPARLRPREGGGTDAEAIQQAGRARTRVLLRRGGVLADRLRAAGAPGAARGGGRPRDRHPQDQARHRDHAGEPVVRQLLRHLSRRRRDPDGERRTDRVQPRSDDAHVRRAVCRPPRRRCRRAARGRFLDLRDRPREDGRLRRGRGVCVHQLRQPPESRVRGRRRGGVERHGIPRSQGHPELLGLRRRLRPPGPHVRAGRVVEPSVAPLRGLRLGGHVHQAQRSFELHEPDQPIAGRTPGPEHHLCVDRHDVPAAQEQGVMGLLRRSGRAARLPEPRGDLLCPRSPVPRYSEHLESPALLRHREERRPNRQYQVDLELLQPGRGRHAARRLVGRTLAGRQRTPAGGDQHRSVVRDEPRQRGDAQLRLELDGDLPDVGRLGRLLRPRRSARRRRQRLRIARTGHRDQPVRKSRLHRPPDAVVRRVQQVHRGRLPEQRSASTPRSTAGPTRGPTCARTPRSSAT